MSTFVTLAEVLESRGAPLEEDEVWALLFGAAEALIDISSKDPGNMCCVISPGSMLLSGVGSVAFKSCGRSEDVGSFASPEMSQSNTSSRRQATEKMVVYSLGMTLYWAVDYQLPQNQAVRLSDSLNILLLSMCEDVAHKRVNLLTVLEACEQQHKAAVLPRPQKTIRQMTEDVLQAERNPNDSAHMIDRSQMVRERLRELSLAIEREQHTDSSRLQQKSQFTPEEQKQHVALPKSSSRQTASLHLLKETGPEFIRMLEEPALVLELPNSIVSNKWRSSSNQRNLTVMMPNGQNILLKCDVKSRGGDVFDMIIAYANLTEHFYFGLAYSDDNEFFFLDNDTKMSKVAPDAWKKVPTATFVLHFRIRYFVYGKNYYQPEHYVSKSVLQKMAMPCLKEELLRLHANNANMTAEEAELEFLKSVQQLPEYGVLFHRAGREKKPVFGELLLGVCAKGVIVYEVINNSRTASLRFHWRETSNITSARRKFIIESSTSKKKHIFLTEKSKVAKYLCDLCSAQHKFHREMNSRQLSRSLASEESIVQYAAVCRTQNNELDAAADDSMSRFCEDVATRIEAKIRQHRDLLEHTGYSNECPTSREGDHLRFPQKGSQSIVIVGEDTTGKLDLGIFIASIVPGGPADRDGRIKPGGRLISLNQLSLEGVSFSEAADIMQSSSSQVELIVSQPKAVSKHGGAGHLAERNYESQSTILADSRAGDEYLDELVNVMMTPKGTNRLHVPEVRIINAQDDYSRSASLISLRPEEFNVTLQKSAGSLGISIAGGVNTGLRYGGIYIKSLVPGGAAEQDGRIQTGDRLLEVDGTRLQGFTDQQAAEWTPMRNSCPAITMTRPFGLKPRDYSFVSDDNVQEVTLKKRLNGLGFSFFITELDTSLDSGSIVRIRTLFPGQPAEESGKIREGDVILSINGEPLKGLSYQKVLQLLRTSPSEVQLLLCRPAQGIENGFNIMSFGNSDLFAIFKRLR
ncbi:FERM and PDZ domain-containing protein 2 [Labeo rohita]|uniref:FERM and PDZ domain-containing protein 2 n=1 Tax=Labeo rohita TaxID=84645 RepID=A0ABQ8M897_LABRO|nr:FERM and PDZ domain-containing protein 2 [Labeo rohita]